MSSRCQQLHRIARLVAAKGDRVFVLTGNPAKIIEATAQGQVVIAIDVEPIVMDLRADVTELSAARQIDVRVRGRSYRAVLTPDLEAGGYTIEVPELPGCITEADSLPEARRMTREAIEAWLDAQRPRPLTDALTRGSRQPAQGGWPASSRYA